MPPEDCGSCALGENHCGGFVWACPDGRTWVQLHCDPPLIDAGVDASPAACDALDSDASAGDASGDGASGQALCSEGWVNPDACPSVSPQPGAACDAAGLECVYLLPGQDGLDVDVCDAQTSAWASSARRCGRTCEPWQSSPVTTAVACGSKPDVRCGDTLTDQEELDRVIRGIADCCGGLSENQLEVQFEGGCPTMLGFARVPVSSDFVSCFEGLVAGRRFSCAASLTCGLAQWSTLR